jgi:hypothetical protein
MAVKPEKRTDKHCYVFQIRNEFIGAREAVPVPSQPNKDSTVESSLNSVFVGEELSEDARMFIRASAAENMWENITVLGSAF